MVSQNFSEKETSGNPEIRFFYETHASITMSVKLYREKTVHLTAFTAN